jgi:hypothetical protein
MSNDKTMTDLQKLSLDETVLSELNFLQSPVKNGLNNITFTNSGVKCLNEKLTEINDFILTLYNDSEVLIIEKSEVLKHLQLVRDLKTHISFLKAPEES